MKVEIRDKKKFRPKKPVQSTELMLPQEEEVSIDIAQILAANQALLKNVCRRMEVLEVRFSSLMNKIEENSGKTDFETNKKFLLFSPPRPIETWEPEYTPLDSRYYSKFSFWTQIFHPEKMRRPKTE
ncbi:MAG: hypothetical protein HQM08_13415 [Candidatus Riflebacteria bacterium]|nr:hypothetical protein [Candidatus Riflebacteria bacterium]